jgi:hypothetical protein
MNKNLVHNEAEFVALFVGPIGALGKEWDRDELEKFLDIEFAFLDGKFQSDMDLDPTIDESQMTSDTIYRKHSDDNFPTEYPCLVLWRNDEESDRFGKVQFQALEFVYPSDFTKKAA